MRQTTFVITFDDDIMISILSIYLSIYISINMLSFSQLVLLTIVNYRSTSRGQHTARNVNENSHNLDCKYKSSDSGMLYFRLHSSCVWCLDLFSRSGGTYCSSSLCPNVRLFVVVVKSLF